MHFEFNSFAFLKCSCLTSQAECCSMMPGLNKDIQCHEGHKSNFAACKSPNHHKTVWLLFRCIGEINKKESSNELWLMILWKDHQTCMGTQAHLPLQQLSCLTNHQPLMLLCY